MPSWSFVMSGVTPMCSQGWAHWLGELHGSKVSFRTKSGEGQAVLVRFSVSGSSWSREQWFPKGGSFAPFPLPPKISIHARRRLAIPGDIFGCLAWERGVTAIWWVEVRDATQQPTVHRTPQTSTPCNKELFSPKCLQCGGWEILEWRKGEERSKNMLKSYSLIPVLPQTEMPNKSGTDPGGRL